MIRCIVVGLLLTCVCFAQTGGEATLSGRITDAATHQPIEGAQISNRGGRGGKPVGVPPGREWRLFDSFARGRARPNCDFEGRLFDARPAIDRRHAGAAAPWRFRDARFRAEQAGEYQWAPGRSRFGRAALRVQIFMRIRWYEGAENSTGFRYPAPATSGDGSFAIENLPPSNYALVIDPPMGGKIVVPDSKRPKDESGYGPTWYPGVPRPEMATPILLGYAENRKLDLRLQKHELLHIAGTFQLPEGVEGGSISVTLGTEERGRPTGAEGEIPRSGGHFGIDGLEEGSYRSTGMDQVEGRADPFCRETGGTYQPQRGRSEDGFAAGRGAAGGDEEMDDEKRRPSQRGVLVSFPTRRNGDR